MLKIKPGKTYLITGGSGFLGVPLCEKIISLQYLGQNMKSPKINNFRSFIGRTKIVCNFFQRTDRESKS